jgi:hypothetical protein
MTNQPPLLDPGSDLPSPMVRPRPGWGGKLHAWFHDNLYLAVFRSLITIAAVLIGASLFHSWRSVRDDQQAAIESPTAKNSYELTATAGQGMTNLAATALSTFLGQQHIGLDAPRYLYAIDTLARIAGWRHLRLGEIVVFRTEDIVRTVISAKALTPSQRAAWARLVK